MSVAAYHWHSRCHGRNICMKKKITDQLLRDDSTVLISNVKSWMGANSRLRKCSAFFGIRWERSTPGIICDPAELPTVGKILPFLPCSSWKNSKSVRQTSACVSPRRIRDLLWECAPHHWARDFWENKRDSILDCMVNSTRLIYRFFLGSLVSGQLVGWLQKALAACKSFRTKNT